VIDDPWTLFEIALAFRQLYQPLAVAPGLRQNNPTGKIPLNASGKSLLQIRPSHPARGAYRDRHERGWDAVDAAASGAQRCSQGGLAKDL
jgi:hypothetical protein